MQICHSRVTMQIGNPSLNLSQSYTENLRDLVLTMSVKLRRYQRSYPQLSVISQSSERSSALSRLLQSRPLSQEQPSVPGLVRTMGIRQTLPGTASQALSLTTTW